MKLGFSAWAMRDLPVDRQIAIVRDAGYASICLVSDPRFRALDAAVRGYWERLGIGPWTIVTFGPDTVRELYYRGHPATIRMRAAFAMTENVQLEIIESLDGPNIYDEFLEAHGEG